jgi:nitrate/TMAO reductase-like tetraheme cytochrome c subunit
MQFKKGLLISLATLMTMSCSVVSWADGDDHERREHDEHEEHEGREHEGHESSWWRSGGPTEPVLASIPQEPEVFQEECGACHMAYQAELLPAASWRAVMAGLEDHFGEDATIDATEHQQILAHLEAFSAERSSSRVSRRVMRRMGSQVYLRISDVPGINREHREHISQRVLARDSIRSIANCQACHTTAAQGEYDEDYVRIPR